MAQQTICPACGAPLEYTGPETTVTCPFCDTQLSVTEQNGETQFRVLGQPQPQKDVLSQPVEGGGEPAGYQTDEVYTVGGASVYNPPIESTPPSSPDFFAGEAGSGAFAPNLSSAQPPAEVTPSGATVYPDLPLPPGVGVAQSSRPNRWLWIGLAVVLGACLLFACLGAALFQIFRNQ